MTAQIAYWESLFQDDIIWDSPKCWHFRNGVPTECVIESIRLHQNIWKKDKSVMSENEQVLVFPESVFKELGEFKGVSREVSPFFENPKFKSALSYQPRAAMEVDPTYKQLIPYCVIKFAVGEREGEKGIFFVYQRTKKGGESRLHDKWSIGVGGHISSEDGAANLLCSYEEGMRRELEEEISLYGNYREEKIGMIYDDSNDVGRVHFGVVHLITLGKESALKPTDPALDKGDFVSYTWLLENIDKFENWSQMVIRELL